MIGKRQLKRMYVCCDEPRKGFFCQKIKQLLGEYVEPVLEYGKADAAYVIGEPTEQMQRELAEIRNRGIPVHEVNENLISQDVYETLIRSKANEKARTEKRETGR